MKWKFQVGSSTHTVRFNQILSSQEAIALFREMLLGSGEAVGVDTKITVLYVTGVENI
jgi:hypothetical protein